MKKTKEQKAITLIALIITIVVLLILAVVAIRAVTGDGIIQYAKNASETYSQKQEEENSKLNEYEEYISQGLTEEELVEYSLIEGYNITPALGRTDISCSKFYDY